MRARCIRALLPLLLAASALGCKQEGGVKVTSFTFHGNHSVTTGQLRQVLATQPSSKLPWGDKRYFNREQFEADLKRIVAFYTDRGFPDARVTSFDVKLSDDQESVAISLTIDEGQPIRVEAFRFEGFESLPTDHRNNLERQMPLKQGQPVDRALLQANREVALDELRDHGHPYASVRIDEEQGTGERQRIITFRANPGPVAYVGDVTITGNSSVGDDVVRRQLAFKPGDLYRASKLHESQRQLYSLELFQFANVEPLRTEERATIVPVRVTLTEGKHRRVNLGVGYGTEEQARAQIDWRHVNFFGGARTAGVFARYSGLDRGVRLNLTQPYLFSPRYSLTLSGQAWHATEPMFTQDTLGGRLTLTRQFGSSGRTLRGRPRMSASLTYANEHEEYVIAPEALEDLTVRDNLISWGLDPRFGTGEGQRSALILDASRNATDNLLDAKRGYVAAVHLEKAGTFLGGSYDYYEVTGEGRFYQTIADRFVFAVQARAGSIDAMGSREVNVPFFKRYFLGGATNLRGWGRFDVAPLSGAGLPIGGTSFMNFSTELRMPIWRDLGGVVFLDGGNVWTNAWEFKPGDLRYAVGPGLRYNTPVGPIRADVGFQLNPIPGLLVDGKPEKRRFRFHFSIGQAF
ncbi:MAG TPA: outer membrane protein assembly factor BamA [Vicinamibacterales bacterium]|nr:outer membrane protein assembly factor BamA [Vicinamibacterales bacterium]